MPPFDYVAPTSLKEAYQLLARWGAQARPLAGGTDLVDQLRTGRRQARLVVDIKRIPQLGEVVWHPAQGLRIGAAVPCTRLREHPLVRRHYPALAEACGLVGSVQIQNRASLGGNICNAAPSADTVPPLLVYGAWAVVGSVRGQRELPLESLFLGPGKTALEADEMVVNISLPLPPPASHACYLRFTPREEMDIAVAGVASLLQVQGGRCTRARIALSAVAPTPLRAREAEMALEGREPSREALQEAADLAARACSPITDVRGSAEYRRALVRVLTRRTLERCLEALGVAL